MTQADICCLSYKNPPSTAFAIYGIYGIYLHLLLIAASYFSTDGVEILSEFHIQAAFATLAKCSCHRRLSTCHCPYPAMYMHRSMPVYVPDS